MDDGKAMAVLEALLFVKEEPLSIKQMAEVLELPEKKVEELLRQMQDDYQKQRRGVLIFKVAGGYKLGTSPEAAPYIEKILAEKAASPLSTAALETLAIIAYKQPISRAEIESIRGVQVDKLLDNLLKRKLIKIVGRKEGVGRPLLYGTTKEFLHFFGLNDLRELPPLE